MEPLIQQLENISIEKPQSGFNVPKPISDELADFLCNNTGDILNELGIRAERDCSLSRTNVTRIMCTYFKKENLQNQENRREIISDEPIQKLFGVNTFTYFQLQSLLSKHVI